MAGSPASDARMAVQEVETAEKVRAPKSVGSGTKNDLYARPLREAESTLGNKLVAIRLFNKYQEKRNTSQFQELSDEDVESDNLQHII